MAESDQKTESKVHSDSDEDGNEILEESPCGRWQKRKEKVPQRDIPGIDMAYLAMDNELGVEVVWNEVQFSERKNLRAQEDKIKGVFDNLTQLEHVNLVKFHKYWMDPNPEKPRVIFITEYMSSGSMSNFLKRTRKGSKTLSEKAWKKWCTQILTALNYLHSREPPIVHGNLTCNTIFIQHNGLIKIGCVAPDAIHQHVKTFRENMKNMHYIAPETTATITPAVDIYAFGICALEMAVLGFQTNGDSTSTVVTQELIDKTLQSLEDPHQMDFISLCLKTDPYERPTARELLFHPMLFEIHSLKLLAAHVVVHNRKFDVNEDDLRVKEENKQKVFVEIEHTDGRPTKSLKYAEISTLELDKLLEDVKNGIYPLTAWLHRGPARGASSASQMGAGGGAAGSATGGGLNGGGGSASGDSRLLSPNDVIGGGGAAVSPFGAGVMTGADSSGGASSGTGTGGGTGTPSCVDESSTASTTAVASTKNGNGKTSSSSDSDHYVETRRAVSMTADVKSPAAAADAASTSIYSITILLKMEDRMSRQLTADIGDVDTAEILASELVTYGFVCEDDRQDITNLIANAVLKYKIERSALNDANNQSIIDSQQPMVAAS